MSESEEGKSAERTPLHHQDPERSDQETSMTRRDFGQGIAAATVVATAIGAGTLETSIRAAAQEADRVLKYEFDHIMKGIPPGRISTEIAKIEHELGILQHEFVEKSLEVERKMSDADFSEFLDKIYRLRWQLGARLKEYENSNPPNSYPIMSSNLAFLFEKKARPLNPEEKGISARERAKRSDARWGLLEGFIDDALARDLYRDGEILDNLLQARSMTRTRIEGLYCGYMGICPPAS